MDEDGQDGHREPWDFDNWSERLPRWYRHISLFRQSKTINCMNTSSLNSALISYIFIQNFYLWRSHLV